MRNGYSPLRRRLCRNNGFTLAELLIVVAIMGIVATAVTSVFISTRRSTTSSEQVVDVQASLRVATTSLARDIQRAGFLVTTDSPWEAKGVDDAASSATQLTLNTTLASGDFARISSAPATNTDPFTVTTGSDDMSEMFSVGDQVRIVRPVSRVEPDDSGGATVYTVSAIPATGQLTLDDVPAIPSNYFTAEDLIVKTAADSTLTQQIRYWLDTTDDVLMKTITWDAEDATPSNVQDRIVARNITALAFDYEPSDDDVHTVVVTLTGSTPADDRDRVIRNSFTIRNY